MVSPGLSVAIPGVYTPYHNDPGVGRIIFTSKDSATHPGSLCLFRFQPGVALRSTPG